MRKEIANTKNKWVGLFIILLLLVFLLITVGVFSKNEDDLNYENNPYKPENNKIELENRLETINKIINNLEANKVKLVKKERRLFILARFFIGVIIVYFNLYCINFNINNIPYSKLNSINESILLSYSFVAFLFYGTPSNFVHSIKAKAIKTLRNQEFHTINELDFLYQEKSSLEKEIKII